MAVHRCVRHREHVGRLLVVLTPELTALIDQHHVEARFGRDGRRRQSGGTATDHQDVHGLVTLDDFLALGSPVVRSLPRHPLAREGLLAFDHGHTPGGSHARPLVRHAIHRDQAVLAHSDTAEHSARLAGGRGPADPFSCGEKRRTKRLTGHRPDLSSHKVERRAFSLRDLAGG